MMRFNSLINELEALGTVGLGPALVGGTGQYTLSDGETSIEIAEKKISFDIDREHAQRLLDALDRSLKNEA